jgi:hypothetical protein
MENTKNIVLVEKQDENYHSDFTSTDGAQAASGFCLVTTYTTVVLGLPYSRTRHRATCRPAWLGWGEMSGGAAAAVQILRRVRRAPNALKRD